ncbi:glutathione S-transferase [Caulobacter sp. Root1455]|uniref:glutathione S-transferase C-terminal domain-containing protein n=1 Tax=unclassified Caulobacter TaxID=2648921 RepID=UPI0006FA4EA4|nr:MULTISPECIES: glutathione S-transferase C-terminal domain-containing protein [unclassified Caulobacter]KQY27786.1 glutathione S-transferase [Caulobacter sp. Root487D2Y]KQY93990.1 glutathione S-transferase [Caulobacter sp. Root1455]
MDLYFFPMACSLATRIAACEAGADLNFLRVDPLSRPKRVEDGTAFLAINPMGQVPVLRTDDGELIVENAVVLQYLADRFPAAGLIPADGPERRKVQSWLGFIGSELHVGVFVTLLSKTAPDGAKAFARERLTERLAFLDAHLKGREFLQGRFSVADAYLFVMLVWARYLALDFGPYPALAAYRDRLQTRPSVARAFDEEFTLFKAAA